MAKRKLRVGLIGCGGNMRHAHVPRLREDGRVEIAAVVDTNRAAADALVEAWGQPATYYENYKRMLGREALDAVLISSPHAMHYPQARDALSKNLHVLVEKPLTTSSRHAKALIELARKKRRILMVSYQRHFFSQYAYARKLVQQGAIGRLRGVAVYVTQDWCKAKGWRLVPELSGGGMFMDTGSHLVAVTLWLSGLRPRQVSAFVDNGRLKVDTNVVVNVEFEGGVLGSLSTFGDTAGHDETVAIHGSKGCMVFHIHQWQMKAALLNGEPMNVPASIKEDSPDAAFCRMIRNRGKGYEVPDFALQVSRMSEAVYKSAEQKRPVKVAR